MRDLWQWLANRNNFWWFDTSEKREKCKVRMLKNIGVPLDAEYHEKYEEKYGYALRPPQDVIDRVLATA